MLPLTQRKDPFCQIAGHTSEEVREILAALETVYQPLFPHLNLRRWSGSIYAWLTQPIFDPTHSGRVTMDYLMKLVVTALEWAYEAGESDVQAEQLEHAVSLLVLRRDTLRLIDGAGPSIEAPAPQEGALLNANGTEPDQDASPRSLAPHPMETNGAALSRAPSADTAKCPFCEVIPIDLVAWAESGTRVGECPHCGATRTLEPHRGVLRFKQHDRVKRKTRTLLTAKRWARRDMTWKVVGGEAGKE